MGLCLYYFYVYQLIINMVIRYSLVIEYSKKIMRVLMDQKILTLLHF